MKHHFLPQVYLKNFTDPACAPNHEPYVWVRAFDQQGWKKKAPENIGWETDYYGITGADGSVSHEIENWWSKSESVFGPAVAALTKNAIAELTTEQRFAIAHFAAGMFVRVPVKIEQEQQAMEKIRRNQLRGMRWFKENNSDVFRELSKLFLGVAVDLDKVNIQDLAPEKFDLTISREEAVKQVIQRINLFRDQIVLQMDWFILKTRASQYFATSDNPVGIHNDDPETGVLAPTWLDIDTEVSFPLSRNLALLARWPKADGLTPATSVVHIDDEFMAEINIRSCRKASRMFVAPNVEFPGSRRLNAMLDELQS